MPEALVVGRDDITAAIDMPSLIDAVERAFVAYSSGRAELPGVIHLEVPEARGEIHVKAGYLHGGEYFAVKVASGFYGLEPPALDGVLAVFDAADGAPAAILLDRGVLTDARTGAAGGVAARHLAPERVERVAVVGTGTQARLQLDALACERSFRHVAVWGRHPDRTEHCVRDLRDRPGLPAGATYEPASSVETAVRDAEVVITCTASREPLVRAEWLAAGTHVTALGSDGVGKQELDAEVLRRADVLACDSREQCLHLGELQHAADQADRAVELGTVISGAAPARSAADQLTVCDLTGVGVQDVAAATLVMERLRT